MGLPNGTKRTIVERPLDFQYVYNENAILNFVYFQFQCLHFLASSKANSYW